MHFGRKKYMHTEYHELLNFSLMFKQGSLKLCPELPIGEVVYIYFEMQISTNFFKNWHTISLIC